METTEKILVDILQELKRSNELKKMEIELKIREYDTDDEARHRRFLSLFESLNEI